MSSGEGSCTVLRVKFLLAVLGLAVGFIAGAYGAQVYLYG